VHLHGGELLQLRMHVQSVSEGSWSGRQRYGAILHAAPQL
jgi:hypothetical protein